MSKSSPDSETGEPTTTININTALPPDDDATIYQKLPAVDAGKDPLPPSPKTNGLPPPGADDPNGKDPRITTGLRAVQVLTALLGFSCMGAAKYDDFCRTNGAEEIMCMNG